MIKEISLYEFQDSMLDKSSDYGSKFSYEAVCSLYDYFEQYAEDTGEEITFDRVAICCDWTEYENIEEVKQNYTDIKDLEDLEQKTQVIPVENTGRLLVLNF